MLGLKTSTLFVCHLPGMALSRTAALVVVALALAASFSLSGCGTVVPRQTPFMENTGDIDMSSRELRVRVVEFGRHFSASVEQAANEIIDAAKDDPDVRSAALLWKMQAIPAAHEAVLQVDPLMSLVDIWAFAMQMHDYFASGAGQDNLGEWQPKAVDTATALWRDATDLAKRVSVSGKIARHESEILAWAQNHPIEQSLLLRDSVIGSGAELLGEQRGAFALVDDMNATTREMANRLAFYNEYLLKQVQWSAQAVASALTSEYHLDSLVYRISSTLETSDRLMTDLPRLVEHERRALMAELALECALVINEIDVQRIATLEALRHERIAALDAVSRERELVLEALRAEREVVMNALTEMMEKVPDHSRSVVDHAVWRLAQLLAVLLVVSLVAALVLLLAWRATARSRG